MSTDISRQAAASGGSRAPARPAAGQMPRPTLSEDASRRDKLDNEQFEKQAAAYATPTTTRPALIVPAEVDEIRNGYGTGSGRLNVLAKVVGKRQDYWTEQSGGGPPFDPMSDSEHAKCEAFFKAHGVRLADQPRQAPANPLRTEQGAAPNGQSRGQAAGPQRTGPAAPASPPAPATAAAEPMPLETAQRLPDAIGGAVRGGLTPPPPATFEIECVLDGFPCKLTLHATSGIAVLEQGGAAIAKLKAQKATPPVAPAVVVSAPAARAEAAGDEPPVCAIHHTPMAKRQGKNGAFWSCPQKLEDGSWCPYKPK